MHICSLGAIVVLFFLAACYGNKCLPRGTVKKRSYIESENGNYKLILKESGDLELLCRDKLLWSSHTSNKDADVFQFQSDGNLVIRNVNGVDVWESNTVYDGWGFDGPPDRLILQDDGNLVLYAGSTAKWSTETYGKCPTGNYCSHSFWKTVTFLPTIYRLFLYHCLKIVQKRSYFWSVFSGICTEYRDLLCKYPYSVRIQEIADHKSFPILDIFHTVCKLHVSILLYAMAASLVHLTI